VGKVIGADELLPLWGQPNGMRKWKITQETEQESNG
jgi:hypothetical protein